MLVNWLFSVARPLSRSFFFFWETSDVFCSWIYYLFHLSFWVSLLQSSVPKLFLNFFSELSIFLDSDKAFFCVLNLVFNPWYFFWRRNFLRCPIGKPCFIFNITCTCFSLIIDSKIGSGSSSSLKDSTVDFASIDLAHSLPKQNSQVLAAHSSIFVVFVQFWSQKLEFQDWEAEGLELHHFTEHPVHFSLLQLRKHAQNGLIWMLPMSLSSWLMWLPMMT